MISVARFDRAKRPAYVPSLDLVPEVLPAPDSRSLA